MSFVMEAAGLILWCCLGRMTRSPLGWCRLAHGNSSEEVEWADMAAPVLGPGNSQSFWAVLAQSMRLLRSLGDPAVLRYEHQLCKMVPAASELRDAYAYNISHSADTDGPEHLNPDS